MWLDNQNKRRMANCVVAAACSLLAALTGPSVAETGSRAQANIKIMTQALDQRELQWRPTKSELCGSENACSVSVGLIQITTKGDRIDLITWANPKTIDEQWEAAGDMQRACTIVLWAFIDQKYSVARQAMIEIFDKTDETFFVKTRINGLAVEVRHESTKYEFSCSFPKVR